jgi:membrane fusion protein, multidrug efflux system
MPMDSSGHARGGDAALDDRTRRPPKTARWLIIMGAIVLAVLGGLYFVRNMRDQAIKAIFAAPKPPIVVAMTEAERQSVPHSLDAIGTIAAVHQVTVAPQVGGIVTQIFFTPGGIVKASDPLAQLDDGPEQADLKNFEAQARYAAIALKRAQELQSRQVGSQATVDQNQSLLDQASANIAKTKALIAQKLIRAPFAGRLGVRQIDLGQYLSPGTPMVTLTQLAQLYVNFTLPEQDAATLAPNQEIEFTVDAYPRQGFQAKINAIEPQIAADTRTVKVQAIAENQDGRLLPGMFAKVRVVLPPLADIVTVPETAVENTLYGDSIYVVKDGGADPNGKPVLKAVRTPVKTGEHFGDRVAILSGLEPGQRVVALGQNKVLFDGAPVAPSDSAGLTPPTTTPVN